MGQTSDGRGDCEDSHAAGAEGIVAGSMERHHSAHCLQLDGEVTSSLSDRSQHMAGKVQEAISDDNFVP
jgi:hypothetical protein